MNRVYVAAAYSRRSQANLVAQEIRALGFMITSRWHSMSVADKQPDNYMGAALMDLHDLRSADIFVRLTDPEICHPEMVSSEFLSCARMVEMGVALERGMSIFVLGGKQNVFDYLPQITHVFNLKSLLDSLRGEPIGQREI